MRVRVQRNFTTDSRICRHLQSRRLLSQKDPVKFDPAYACHHQDEGSGTVENPVHPYATWRVYRSPLEGPHAKSERLDRSVSCHLY